MPRRTNSNPDPLTAATRGRNRGRPRSVESPVKQQDGTDYGKRIEQTVNLTYVAPIAERIETIEKLLAGTSSFKVRVAQLELPRSSGRCIVAAEFQAFEVGAPVMVCQAPFTRFDEAEGGIICFVARVLDTKRLQVAWWAPFKVPRKVSIHYVVGAA